MASEPLSHWHQRAIERPGRWIPVVGVLAEDEDGYLCVPRILRRNWWGPKFDPRKPWHWPSYLHSRLTCRITMVARDS
jgi:hypothetical protein